MSWTSGNNDWDLELQRMRYIESLSGGASPAIAPSAGANGGGGSSLPNSASCPSFTDLSNQADDAFMSELMPGEQDATNQTHSGGGFASNYNGFFPYSDTSVVYENKEMPFEPYGQDAALSNSSFHMNAPNDYNHLLDLQQQNQSSTMRQYPHTNNTAMGRGTSLASGSAKTKGRGNFHGSASFTSLANMEREHRRQAGKLRPRANRQLKCSGKSLGKQHRHQSLVDLSSKSTLGSMRQRLGSTPETHAVADSSMEDASNDDMIGFSIDDLPETLTSDSSWPEPPSSSFETSATSDQLLYNSSPPVDTDTTSTRRDSLPSANDIDLLLNDQDKANMSSLFDAIRDFEDASESSDGKVQCDNSRLVNAVQRKSGDPPTTVLSNKEQNQMQSSPLFSSPDKITETAGSLWLLLHVQACSQPSSCTISGCQVMQKVFRHCIQCPKLVGDCQTTCNEAKMMLLHFGSCTQALSKQQPPTCSLCSKLQDIDNAHHALQRSKANSSMSDLQSLDSPAPEPLNESTSRGGSSVGMTRVASAPVLSSLEQQQKGSRRPVPIKPNPLPTASNPMGIMGSYPHMGYSLALYMEQTSPPFREEVKDRIEKKVKAAAGQDLVRHMKKKTRLRSLDELRGQARTTVLGELERELHWRMQGLHNWSQQEQLPDYLSDLPTNGVMAFHAHQSRLQAAMLQRTGEVASKAKLEEPAEPV